MLQGIESLIKEIVDFEGSSMEARFIVKRGVDEEVLYQSQKQSNMIVR